MGHTLSVVMEISELVTPLCYDTNSVLQESHYNQESSNCWEISIPQFSVRGTFYHFHLILYKPNSQVSTVVLLRQFSMVPGY